MLAKENVHIKALLSKKLTLFPMQQNAVDECSCFNIFPLHLDLGCIAQLTTKRNIPPTYIP